MPLIRFDMIEGRSAAELQQLLDVTHRVALAALNLPEGDRYQIVTQHPRAHMVIEDTGLGFTRSDRQVVIQLVTRPRAAAAKQAFYQSLAAALQQECGLRPEDLVITMTVNSDEDWSFGKGEAQFLTGAL